MKPLDILFIIILNIQGDKSVGIELDGGNVDIRTESESTGTDSDSESEHVSSEQSPVSGSVHYFIAPLDSSKAQDMMIEELDQVKPVCVTIETVLDRVLVKVESS